jgi:hypothetical protein
MMTVVIVMTAVSVVDDTQPLWIHNTPQYA